MVDKTVLFLWEMDSGLIYRILWDLGGKLVEWGNTQLTQAGILSKMSATCYMMQLNKISWDFFQTSSKDILFELFHGSYHEQPHNEKKHSS